ncbi:flavodoxin family protein [Streptomyces sp. NPDC004111]|uniref:flavodoxin family protein n=1 Tax=Streptomyces sp. NPDC004111 TaxID=3364690 RepID=UPI00369896AD
MTTETSSTATTDAGTGTDTGTPTDRSFLFVLGSSRPDGNTELLARAAAAQLPAGFAQNWVDLNRLALPDFQDGRHDAENWSSGETEDMLREATLAATDVVIASPLYWYTVSAQVKRYLDYWSGWLTAPGSDFKARMTGRRLWAVSVMAHSEPEVADGMVATLRNSAAYMGMGFGGLLLGSASRPGQIRQDEEALLRAKTFFQGAAPLARFPYESPYESPHEKEEAAA